MFGQDLDTLIRNENPHLALVRGPIPRTTETVIPRALDICLAEIERRGLTDLGLCG